MKLKFIALAIILQAAGLGFAGPAMAQADPATMPGEPVPLTTMPAPILVELFTSEGCSSCPPADAYLGELAQRKHILALSYHVDYWDHLGWRDRFGDPRFTERQRDYAAAMGERMVYTPQMIVAGAIDVVGSRRADVEAALDRAYTRNSMYRLHLRRDGEGNLTLILPAAPISVPASLWLVTYSQSERSRVTAGENAGSDLVSVNVVRSLRKIGMWDGQAASLVFALTLEERAAGPDSCAIIANEADFGPVVAAAAWNFAEAW